LIAVVDYGMGNIRSVAKAFETAGATVEVTHNPRTISEAEAIVLPGVGAFARGMENLKKLNIIPSIHDAAEKRIPVLGICLGLQLLFTESEEHGVHKGMGLIKGRVKKFPESVKIPHMGWNNVKVEKQNVKCKMFDGIADDSHFYFVHSYYVEPEDKNVIIGTTEYGEEFVSAINRDSIWGVQFHPEKSSKSGLEILRNLCSYAK
jgi:glutamine amidotransferase